MPRHNTRLGGRGQGERERERQTDTVRGKTKDRQTQHKTQHTMRPILYKKMKKKKHFAFETIDIKIDFYVKCDGKKKMVFVKK
jgi:hypothetical protein